MKCVIPEISWHNRDPVLSVDIQPKRPGDSSTIYRLASGGTDSHVLIWYLNQNDEGTINLEIAANLTRHQRPVNVVRWSPSGEFLASGDDESIIFIWKLKGDAETINILDSANDQDKETWLTYKILRGHLEDVYDLSWAPNSLQLISGSVDNTAMVWDIARGKSQAILREHNSFVQGVAWDPQNQLLATLSSDRHFRAFDAATKKVLGRSNKCTLPVPANSPVHGKQMRIFHDDTLQTFFRRLSFSPDGELIVTPSGVAETGVDGKMLHTTYIYTRYNLKQPTLVLPSPDQYTVAVRFCPILYKLHDHDEDSLPVIQLPYRMIFAVATKSSVYLYDTQQPMPFGLISNIHYTRLTDLAWSHDGRILTVSSTDGFCTLITFASDELGEEYVGKKIGCDVNSAVKSNTPSDTKKANKSKKSLPTKRIDSGHEPVQPDQPDIVVIEEPENIVTSADNSHKSALSGIATVDSTITSAKTIPTTPVSVLVPQINNSEEVIALEIPPGIISTKDKFESPEITSNKPATPISYRRAPRPNATTPSTPFGESTAITVDVHSSMLPVSAPSPLAGITGKCTAAAVEPKPTPTNNTTAKSTKSSSKPTPIAVRRHPRAILPTSALQKVDPSSTEDEALDAWPIDEPQPVTDSFLAPVICDKDRKPHDEILPMDVDTIDDIRLIYDDVSQTDDVDIMRAPDTTDAAPPPPADVTPSAKTPRRVELRTISTPKAKKKLI